MNNEVNVVQTNNNKQLSTIIMHIVTNISNSENTLKLPSIERKNEIERKNA